MYRKSLEGTWQLTIDPRSENTSGPIKGTLPGCNYLDLMAAGMEDPFYGTNENTATEKGHHDHSYSRKFVISPEELELRVIYTLTTGFVDALILVEGNAIL